MRLTWDYGLYFGWVVFGLRLWFRMLEDEVFDRLGYGFCVCMWGVCHCKRSVHLDFWVVGYGW